MIYVEELIGPETVNTMPPRDDQAFQDHGQVARTIDGDVDGARRVQAIADAGIDYDDVVGDARARGRRQVRRLVPSADRASPRASSGPGQGDGDEK